MFRRALVVRAGRAYRAAELRFKLWMLRLGRPPRSPPLSEHDATQVGADIIGASNALHYYVYALMTTEYSTDYEKR